MPGPPYQSNALGQDYAEDSIEMEVDRAIAALLTLASRGNRPGLAGLAKRL
jgi:hypothetical protein